MPAPFSFLGKNFTSPLIGTSGTVGYGNDFAHLTSLEHLGALVLKTLTPKPLAGNSHPRVIETEFGLINSIGLQNIGIDGFIEKEYPNLKKMNQAYNKKKNNLFFIISLAAFTTNDFLSLVKKSNQLSAISFIEINLSCPNVDYHNKEFSTDQELLKELVEGLVRVSQKPLIIKLSPEVNPISEMALTAQKAGAQALTIGNTFKGIKLDTKNRKPFIKKIVGGYSGPPIKPLMLNKVYETAQRVSLPIIGCGGVMHGNDVVEYLLVGASLVGIGTANLINPKLGIKVFKQFNQYLKKHKLSHPDLIGEIIG